GRAGARRLRRGGVARGRAAARPGRVLVVDPASHGRGRAAVVRVGERSHGRRVPPRVLLVPHDRPLHGRLAAPRHAPAVVLPAPVRGRLPAVDAVPRRPRGLGGPVRAVAGRSALPLRAGRVRGDVRGDVHGPVQARRLPAPGVPVRRHRPRVRGRGVAGVAGEPAHGPAGGVGLRLYARGGRGRVGGDDVRRRAGRAGEGGEAAVRGGDPPARPAAAHDPPV